MKKTNITIPFEEEKLKALRLFAGKRNSDIDAELEDVIQKLYEKYVPKDARELLEMMVGSVDASRTKTTKKVAPQALQSKELPFGTQAKPTHDKPSMPQGSDAPTKP